MPAPWGKTADGQTHHLAHHCADVAACFERMAAFPAIRDRLAAAAQRRLNAIDIARLTALTFLHDSGKLHPGFQAKGWPKEQWHGPKRGHVSEGLAIFASRCGHVTDSFPLNKLGEWAADDTILGLLRAAIGHHGRPFQIKPDARRGWDPVPANGYDPAAAARELAELLPQWFAPAFAQTRDPLPATPAFQHLFCGLVTLADWIGSNRAVFHFAADLQGDYMDAVARPRARNALSMLGLDTEVRRRAMADPSDFSWLVPGYPPRPMQRIVGAWSIHDRLLILEAETGSGKTEAALWHFARLFAAGQVDSLYFAVPTRAAATQLHHRVCKAMRNLFGDNAPEPVLAVPGYLKVGDVSGLTLPDYRVLWEDAPDEALMLSRWAGESSKRYLAAMISIGTVDQAMLAALQVKHAHLRAASLSRALLVIDEVHASDRYMSEIQTHLLETHLGWGGSALLMSATLGSSARTRWLTARKGAPPSFTEAVAAPYPAIWSREGEMPEAVRRDGRSKTVRMRRTQDWDAATAAQLAIAAAQRGARVLMIRNTVAAALAAFDAVCAQGGADLLLQVAGRPALHHSRFAPEDRALIDTAVEAALSGNPDLRPGGGCIVVGTQTLEIALDLCADYLITDLCPADVLLQRIGRLHRHALPRPIGFEQAQCVVLAPAEGLDRLATPKFDNGIGGWLDSSGTLAGIYTDLPCCELTLALITDHPEWDIPAMNRFLVESATHEEKIEELIARKGPAWQNYWNKIYGARLAERIHADNLLLRTDRSLDDKFPDGETKIRTRLGEEGARIPLPEGTIGPFGAPISVLTLPAHWSIGIDPNAIEMEASLDSIILSFKNNTLRYGRQGLLKDM